jgi:Flp pilus assembly pilin Flp
MTFRQFISNFNRDESGQDLLEYALVLAAVLAAVVVGSGSLAGIINNGIASINLKITSSIALAQ